MVLTTERLRIEPLRSQHAGMVYESLQESQIYSYIPEDPPSQSDLQRRSTTSKRHAARMAQNCG